METKEQEELRLQSRFPEGCTQCSAAPSSGGENIFYSIKTF